MYVHVVRTQPAAVRPPQLNVPLKKGLLAEADWEWLQQNRLELDFLHIVRPDGGCWVEERVVLHVRDSKGRVVAAINFRPGGDTAAALGRLMREARVAFAAGRRRS